MAALKLALALVAVAALAVAVRAGSPDDEARKLAKQPLNLGDMNIEKDGIDNMIDGFVNAVKKGDTAVFGGAKATVLANSNVLMHKEAAHGGDFEDKMKRTKEEGGKAKAEDAKKVKMEEGQKKLEDRAKKNVQKAKLKLRQESLKQEREQDQKTAAEERAKANEAQAKKQFEAQTKATVRNARKKAAEEEKKAAKKLEEQRAREDAKKTKTEKKTKMQIREARDKAEARKRAVRREAKAKELAERRKKEAKRKQEASKKREESTKEKKKKWHQRHAKGKWCGCTSQRVHFDRMNAWHNCPEGTLITGIYRGQYHNLANIYYYRCCAPCKEDGRSRQEVSSCSAVSWYSSMRSAGWSYCPANSYLQGLYKGSCNYLYCLEQARCCFVAGSRGRSDCNTKGSWGSSLDYAGWSYLDNDRFIVGLYRSGDNYLYNLEYPNQCAWFAYP